jgi:hypothetical protein
MIKLSEKAVCEEASMRMVYKALGIRPQTTELGSMLGARSLSA